MAFATSNVTKSVFGNMKVLLGNWSGAAGDAPGTIQVEGGQVYLANFQPQTSSGPEMVETASSVSGTQGVVTVTVYNSATVSNGTFIIISK
jgi:hypothetical protein